MLEKIGFRQTSEAQKTNQATQPGFYANRFQTQTSLPSDKLNLSGAGKVISFSGNNFEYKQHRNVINLISFTGLQDPKEIQPLGIQMRVTGVMSNQVNEFADAPPTEAKAGKNGVKKMKENSRTINKLAESNWTDGQEVKFNAEIMGKSGDERMGLSVPKFGKIGRVPDEIYPAIEPLLKNSEYSRDIKFELSNVIAGTSKGCSTIGLRVNCIYTGTDSVKRAVVEEAFNKVLNDPECKEKAMLYQPKTQPDEVLKMILNHETQLNGAGSAKKMETAISNIVSEFENPANKKILLVGHCKPDGDTLGCVLGLKNALGLKYEDKQVDCAVDDKVPGLFRHNMPGIDGEIKRPLNPDRENDLHKEIEELQSKPQDAITKTEIEILKEEEEAVKNPANLLDPNTKYDLVVMMDVPTPERFSGAFKKYLVDENGAPAKNSNGEAVKTIYIDHHPHRLQEWKDAQPKTGLNMEKIHQNGLAWVADAVPAATQLVTVIAGKMIPALNDIGSGKTKADEVFKEPGQLDKVKAFVASTITGMSTDTGSYLRTANLLPEHMLLPAQQRPNFAPEGMTKWLIGLTDGIKDRIDKKWLREEISYDLNDNKIPELPLSARETMLDYSIKGKLIPEDSKLGVLGLGIVQVDYDKMFGVWDLARKSEKSQPGGKAETTFLDVQNGFKYGEVMNILRANPEKHGASVINPRASAIERAAMEDYTSNYDADRIAILICQDKKAGCIDEKLNIAEQNGLRLSLRSQEGSIHAELLAQLFGGGGHGGASGGRLDLPGVGLDTKLAVEIDGVKSSNPKQVLAQLKANHEIQNDNSKTDEQKTAECKKVKVVLDEELGNTCSDLITELVVEMRKAAKEETAVKPGYTNYKAFEAKKSNSGADDDNVFEVRKNNKHKGQKLDNVFDYTRYQNHKPDSHGKKNKNYR